MNETQWLRETVAEQTKELEEKEKRLMETQYKMYTARSHGVLAQRALFDVILMLPQEVAQKLPLNIKKCLTYNFFTDEQKNVKGIDIQELLKGRTGFQRGTV